MPVALYGHLCAVEQEASTVDGLDENAGHELDLFMDLPMVVSASRQEVPLHKSSAAVTVVDDEDLLYRAHRNLDQAIKYSLGINHLVIDRRRYAMGVHGLHDYSSDRLFSSRG